MNFIVDKAKALKKWSPVLEHLNVVDSEKKTWMAEYAEMHQLNENVAYSTMGSMYGMGNVTAPVIGGAGAYGNVNAYTGNGNPQGTGTNGSGDVAQNLLPVSMKIAAQTIGLDLVAVKPASSPRMELLFVDFKYDNNAEGHGDAANADQHPLIFKLSTGNNTTLTAALTVTLNAAAIQAREYVGGLDKNVYIYLSGGTSNFAGTSNPSTTIAAGDSKIGCLEFLGFSRVDGLPMFRTFRQSLTMNTTYSQPKNTFYPYTDKGSVVSQLSATTLITSTATTYALVGTPDVQLVSTMEDQIPGFSANWYVNHAMTRLEDENAYPGVIGPDVFTKSVAVGDIEISSALKRTQIEDIKASTGMDIVQKLESVLINELTQTISKQIVDKIRTLAAENRSSHTTPKLADGTTSKFDFNVDTYTAVNGPAPGGETYHSIQRKLVAKINNASNFIATDGRVGPAQYLVTNGNIASVLQDVAGYTINPVNASKLNTNGQLYPMGNIGNISIYVDPYMRWDDNRIFLGRKNSVDQPGLVFIPYLMAQSISLISESTWAPRMLIRSRYAITDIGFFPWKQFMEIVVTDTNGVLI